MGGYTELRLKNCSRDNIDVHNARLELARVPKQYRFYSKAEVIFEYESFKVGKGVFPEHLFPKDKINSFEDFKKYWSGKHLGANFCPPFGTLRFDCYFGRTPHKVMRKLGKYLLKNISEFKKAEGSFESFMEKVMTDEEIEIVKKSGIKY